MSADDSLLFIDTNKYLDLYRMNQGKKLLERLRSQIDFIFVTQQIVNEVQRNKIKVAAEFLLGKKPKELDLKKITLPNQLFSQNITDQHNGILQSIDVINQEINKIRKNEVNTLMFGIMKEIKRSEDEVSKTLSLIFDKAVPHSSEELQRARDRKELGNPPGKTTDSIGDQLTWEQILTHFEGKKRLWIITKDRDYGEVYGNETFLSRFLYDELCSISSEPEVYLFEDMNKGISHFIDTMGVNVEQDLTPEDVEEIEREEESLSYQTQLDESWYRMLGYTEKRNLIENIQQQIDQQLNEKRQRMFGMFGYTEKRNLIESIQQQTDQQLNEKRQKMFGNTRQPNFVENIQQQINSQVNENRRELLGESNQFSTSADQSLEENQEEKNEKPQTFLPSSHEGDSGGKKDDEGKIE